MKNTGQNADKDLDYYCTFGNIPMRHYKYLKETLKRFWKRMCQYSYSNRVGDVSLFYKEKLIRGCWNWNKKITDKDIKYKCQYHKY